MAELRVTVLGSGPAWANPGGACSGYLVSSGSDHVLVECGFGILSRLREQLPLDQLRAVVFSHLHADHFMDLVPLRYGLKYGGLRSDPRLPLFGPPGSTRFLRELGCALDGDPHFFDGTYRVEEFRPGEVLSLGDLAFEFREVKHYIPSYGMVIQAERRLAFSADAAPCEALVEIAREADLFLCEAAISSLDQDDPDPAQRGHLTAGEAGEIARRAAAGRLLLTHYRAREGRDQELVEAASRNFGKPAELAVEGRTYAV